MSWSESSPSPWGDGIGRVRAGVSGFEDLARATAPELAQPTLALVLPGRDRGDDGVEVLPLLTGVSGSLFSFRGRKPGHPELISWC
jgi:hypothetical protein